MPAQRPLGIGARNHCEVISDGVRLRPGCGAALSLAMCVLRSESGVVGPDLRSSPSTVSRRRRAGSTAVWCARTGHRRTPRRPGCTGQRSPMRCRIVGPVRRPLRRVRCVLESDAGGRATSTASTASSTPRSPSDRRMHPNSLAGIRSSLGLEQQHTPVEHRGVAGKRPAVRIHWITSMHPPQVRPVTARAGPAHAHGSVGSRSPYSVSDRGVVPVLPKSSDSPGSVTSSRLAGEQRGSQGRQRGRGRRRGPAPAGPGWSRRRSRRRPGSTATTGCWCCRCSRGTVWDRREPGRVQVGDDGDLVLAADRGEDGADIRDQRTPRSGRPRDLAASSLPGGGVLHGTSPVSFGRAGASLVHGRPAPPGCGERGGHDRDRVTGLGFAGRQRCHASRLDPIPLKSRDRRQVRRRRRLAREQIRPPIITPNRRPDLPHYGPFAAPHFHRHSPQAEHRVITEPTSCEPQIGISCATSILSGFMERVQTKAWLPKVRKGLVEANRRFLAEQVDPFTTGNSQRFFDERPADPTTAIAGADSEVREKCLELPVTEQLRESDDVLSITATTVVTPGAVRIRNARTGSSGNDGQPSATQMQARHRDVQRRTRISMWAILVARVAGKCSVSARIIPPSETDGCASAALMQRHIIAGPKMPVPVGRATGQVGPNARSGRSSQATALPAHRQRARRQLGAATSPPERLTTRASETMLELARLKDPQARCVPPRSQLPLLT